MKIKTLKHSKFVTKSSSNEINGFLVPIYNIHDQFFDKDTRPEQVYLTVIKKNSSKGPHLHYIRTGCFTCIKGNAAIILKIDEKYETFVSGEKHNFLSVLIPTGVPAMICNIDNNDAYIINTPYPAWTPDMDDEHTADFSDYDINDLYK